MEWFSEHLAAAWLGLAILLGVAEMFSLDLILGMLAVGALVGMLSAALSAPVVLQVLLAAGASVAMLGFIRPSLTRRLHAGPELRLGHGKLVGTQGVVLQQVTKHVPGRVRLAGEVWTAEPYDDTLVIEPGETVDVLEIRGATALVHPVPRLDPPPTERSGS